MWEPLLCGRSVGRTGDPGLAPGVCSGDSPWRRALAQPCPPPCTWFLSKGKMGRASCLRELTRGQWAARVQLHGNHRGPGTGLSVTRWHTNNPPRGCAVRADWGPHMDRNTGGPCGALRTTPPPQGPCGYCPHPATRQGGGATGSQLLPLPCSSDAHSFSCRLSLSSDPVQDST